MLSAMLASKPVDLPKFPLLELPQEMVEKVAATLGPEDQKAKKAARSTCTRLRSAINTNVSSVRVGSDMEGQTLPPTLMPQLKTITLDISNGNRSGLWSARNLALLGVSCAPADCRVAIEADAAILNLSKLRNSLAESGLLPRVQKLSQQSWGLDGPGARFGTGVEVSAKLKCVRIECIDELIHNTLAHDNLASLCFAPMLQKAWNQSLIREINRSASKTLRSLAVNFRPFQEVNMEPLAEMDLPELEHLELRAQNEHGFGARQLQPLATAKLPKLRSLAVELTGSGNIPHLGEFLRPLVGFPELESIEIWANSISSFAGLWGVGVGGVYLPKLRSLSLRVSACGLKAPRAVFAANPPDKVVDAFAGLTLDRLELHDIGLPNGASAQGIKQLVLTNPRWEDLRIAMSPEFSPDLKVIRVCGNSARAMRTRMLDGMLATPSVDESGTPGWRIGTPPSPGGMAKVRSFLVLHDLEGAKSV